MYKLIYKYLIYKNVFTITNSVARLCRFPIITRNNEFQFGYKLNGKTLRRCSRLRNGGITDNSLLYRNLLFHRSTLTSFIRIEVTAKSAKQHSRSIPFVCLVHGTYPECMTRQPSVRVWRAHLVPPPPTHPTATAPH